MHIPQVILFYIQRENMKKPLLFSLAAATLLSSNLSAESMYERIQAMELQMEQMQNQIATLKAQNLELTTQEKAEDSETAQEPEDEEESSEEEESDDAESSEAEESQDDREPLQDQIDYLEESISELNRATYGNHLKFGVDYRFTLENLQYEMADGSTQSNDAFMTNRFWLNMDWKATDNLSFRGQMAYNKAFGARSGAMGNPANAFDTFDWITNENAYDDTLRIRSAYFLYVNDTFLGTDVPWTFSIGRRPSTNGHLVNLRDNDPANSPMGHTINVEFDGLSAKFGLENVTGINGMYAKLCAGRGLTNAAPKFSGAPYAKADGQNPDIDLAGVIFVPWTNGQYGVATQYYYADNLIDAVNPMNPMDGMQTVGAMHSFTANFTANGIGDEISDYLDDSIFFISGAMSQTNPDDGQNMLGSTESETGYSLWAGLQMPSLMSDYGRWGVEYNMGSRYWRSITYAEDTNIGSKLAARGNAYELYFTEPLIEDMLTLQVRYTYIDYKYAGSNGFFGGTTGNAMSISDIQNAAALGDPQMMGMAANVVDTAQDIRFYLRYRF